MIRVIGKDPKHVKQISCRECASVIEYTNADTTTVTVRDYGGGSDTYRYLACPVCRKDINVGLA